jgi:hypothetical protein
MDLRRIGEIYAAYLDRQISREIHPADHMWNTGQAWYDVVGRSGVECVLRGLAATQLQTVGSVLDLACGHGRVARHLRACFPEAQMFFCDMEGADFCATTFGGTAIISENDLLRVKLPAVDVIWVGSLFTHVSEDRTSAWIAHAASRLNPHGVLVATFHGRTSLQLLRGQVEPGLLDRVARAFEPDGYVWESYGGDWGDWGVSAVTPSRLLAIASRVPGVHIGGFTEGAWAANHDVLTLVRAVTEMASRENVA